MNTKATATLRDGSKVSGRLTTDHSASSYGQPIFVDNDNQVIDYLSIVEIKINHAAALGSTKSERKAKSSRENGRLGGRPKK